MEDRPNNDVFMQFEEEIDDTIHCDEIENEDYTGHYVTEDNNNVTEEIVETEEECDVTEEECDVTEEERDVTEEECDVTEEECDVTEEEHDEEIVEEGEHDVTEESNDSDDSLVELYTYLIKVLQITVQMMSYLQSINQKYLLCKVMRMPIYISTGMLC